MNSENVSPKNKPGGLKCVSFFFATGPKVCCGALCLPRFLFLLLVGINCRILNGLSLPAAEGKLAVQLPQLPRLMETENLGKLLQHLRLV